MSEKRQILTAAQLRPLLPVLAVVLLLLAGALAWTGWLQMQDATRSRLLQQARDMVADGTARALRQQEARLQERLALPDVQAALAAGDLELAATEMRRDDWPRLDSLELLSTDLDAAYAGLADGGAGRLSALEGALLEGAPVSRIIRDDGVRVVLAAPAKAGDKVVAIAYARLPLGIATAALESANVAGDTYLALRQDNYTVAQRGDVGLTDSAEFLSVPVKGTDLRISAGLPEETTGVFGLGSMHSFIGAGVLVLLALGAWGLMRRSGRVVAEEAVEGPAPTLEQALEQGIGAEVVLGEAVPGAPVPAGGTLAAAAAGAGGVPAAPPVALDPGIFRAYDIRGIVGQTLDIGVAEAIGRAVGSLMQEQGATDIVIGRDGRLSGPDLVAGLIEGLRKAGRNVIDIGMVPTPVVYFGTYHLHTGCGI